MLHHKTNYNVNVKEQFARERKFFLQRINCRVSRLHPSGVTPTLWWMRALIVLYPFIAIKYLIIYKCLCSMVAFCNLLLRIIVIFSRQLLHSLSDKYIKPYITCLTTLCGKRCLPPKATQKYRVIMDDFYLYLRMVITLHLYPVAGRRRMP